MTTEIVDLPPDDSLAEIKALVPGLNEQELLYVYWRSLAVPPAESYKRAGFEDRGWRKMETRPIIRQAVERLNEALEPEYQITRKRVVAIMLEGIEIARRKDQAKTMIEGAVALANLAGMNAPQRLQVQQQIEHTHNRPTAGTEALMLSRLPRHELEALLDKKRVLPVLEAEFVDVTPKQLAH